MWSWERTKNKTGKAFRWFFVECIKGGISYYFTRRAVEDGAEKIGDEVRDAGKDVMINYTTRF